MRRENPHPKRSHNHIQGIKVLDAAKVGVHELPRDVARGTVCVEGVVAVGGVGGVILGQDVLGQLGLVLVGRRLHDRDAGAHRLAQESCVYMRE